MNPEALSDEQINSALDQLDVAWSAIPGEGLVRVISTGSFGRGLLAIQKIGKLAEDHNHHPEITLRQDEVEVTLTTHSAGGVTQHDIDLARAIDKLAV